MNSEYSIPPIPAYITVHLGAADDDADNVTVTYYDYIKGAVSANLPSGLPDEAVKAIIIAQSSLALSRIQSGYYRSDDYPFDITNDESTDQGYIQQGGIDIEYSRLVDEYFTYYVAKNGAVEPLPLRVCYSNEIRCRGISLNESVDLALNGYSAEQILEYFYGKNIYIEENALLFGLETDGLLTYPMKMGDRGKNVSGLQIALNRIAANYTSIPRIDDIDGIYGETTFEAVSAFQQVFDMQVSGMVDQATFHRLSYIYDSIRNLSELVDQGEELADIPTRLRADLEYGSVGNAVKLLQYYLLFVSAFDSRIPKLEVIGVFGEKTYQSVTAFQRAFGFEPDGVVTQDVWNTLIDVYEGLYAALPPSAFSQTAVEYFGNILLFGSEGREVRYLQEYLKTAAERYEEIPSVVVNGYFDKQTEEAVKAFQRLFGIRESGVVSSTTWRILSQVYNAVMGG